jgi:NAD(P)-dependent dehydrogenase (short-subunit alcohol dehydrogenase family)
MPENDAPAPLAVVTGAARRLGKAIAQELAARGYAIGLHYRGSVAEAEGTAAELRSQGVPVLLLRADLTQPAEIEAMFAQIDRQPNPLRVLVNSAATMPDGDLRDLSVAEWDAVMAINLRAPWLCAQQAARRMSGGVIINLSDSGAHKTWSKYPAYVLSKNGVETLTRLLAKSLAPAIRVNAVAPGLILPEEGFPQEEWQRLVARLPIRRPGTPQAVAQAVVFLIENEYMTGETIIVDGGYQLV